MVIILANSEMNNINSENKEYLNKISEDIEEKK
jgi:hypothetical protein